MQALVIASAVMLASLGIGPAWAQTTSCQLAPVFVMLRNQVGRDRVGECSGPMVRNEGGDMTQPTTRGILTLRSTDQVVAFNDGQTTWLFGPNGLESRPSGSRLAWENEGTGRSTGGTATASATPAYGTPTSAYGMTPPSYGSTAYSPSSTSAAYATPTVYPAPYAASGTATGGQTGLSPIPSPSPMVPLTDELPMSISGNDESSSKPFNLAGGDYPMRWEANLQHGKTSCYVGARLRRFDDQNPGALVMHTTLGSTKDPSVGGDTRLFSVAPGRYVLDVATTGCSWKLTIQAPQ
jgi:hypothetical protein